MALSSPDISLTSRMLRRKRENREDVLLATVYDVDALQDGRLKSVSRGNADASAAKAAGLKIFQFRLALSCVAEIFCINFT